MIVYRYRMMPDLVCNDVRDNLIVLPMLLLGNLIIPAYTVYKMGKEASKIYISGKQRHSQLDSRNKRKIHDLKSRVGFFFLGLDLGR